MAIRKRFRVGERVVMTEDALENYGEKWRDRPLRIIHVSTKYMPAKEFFARGKPEGYHPGFDASSESALYDFDEEKLGSLYDWELTRAPSRRR